MCYNTSQLQLASKIKAYRQLGFSIQQIKQIVSKGNEKEILKEKLEDYLYQKEQILKNLSILKATHFISKCIEKAIEMDIPYMDGVPFEEILDELQEEV